MKASSAIAFSSAAMTWGRRLACERRSPPTTRRHSGQRAVLALRTVPPYHLSGVQNVLLKQRCGPRMVAARDSLEYQTVFCSGLSLPVRRACLARVALNLEVDTFDRIHHGLRIGRG